MNLVNENVEHIVYGLGVVAEVIDNKIWVQFQDEIGKKAFLYPEAFEKFLKAVNPAVENYVLEELHKKLEQLEMEMRMEREREAAELEGKKTKSQASKRKTTVKTTKKKSEAS